MTTNSTDNVRDRLDGVRPMGSGKWVALCPAHDDRHASLSIGEGGDGKVLLKCHAGCSVDDIISAMDIKMTDLFPQTSKPSYDPRASQQTSDPWAWITQKTGLPQQAFESLGVVYDSEQKGFLYSFNGTAVKKVRPLQGAKGRWVKPDDAATPDLWPSPPETVPGSSTGTSYVMNTASPGSSGPLFPVLASVHREVRRPICRHDSSDRPAGPGR